MRWIGRIYKHNGKYDIIIDFEDGNSFEVFGFSNYRELKEKVYKNIGIHLVDRKDLHFLRNNGMELSIINAANNKTESSCVTVQEVKSGLFDYTEEVKTMREKYKNKER